MKPKTLILMVVAVTCGLGASYMTSRLLAERQPEETDKVPILVAKKNLDMGVTVKRVEDLFEIKNFVKGDEPKNAIAEPKDLLARVLKRSLRTGDFVTGDDLLSDKDVGLSALMAQGYRAMGIRVNIQDIASGFASLPMSRVDLLWTMRRTNDKDSAARILLENVLVLAADTSTGRPENSGAMPATVVTVALKPEDALKVAMARELGTISMALRKFNDHMKSEVSSVTVEELVTNAPGRKDSEESWEATTGQPASAKLELPPLPTENVKSVEVAKAEPKGTLHRMRLIEGDKERVVEYWLDETGQVIHNDVVRSEISGAPPRPPQATPTPTSHDPVPQPQPQPEVSRPPQPAPPAPVDDDDN